jgi:drug/metabolite transporter (DMT)-like permease
MLAAAGAAVMFGAAYPVTAVALRSFQPVALAGLQATIGLLVVAGLAAFGVVERSRLRPLEPRRLARLFVLGLLGGTSFIVGMNVAVALSGPTITGFVAALYAVLAALFAVPILGERIRPRTVLAFAVALVGTALLADLDTLGESASSGSLVGVGSALLAAVAYGLYLALARRWVGPYRLDTTLVTCAILAGRGPLLLLFVIAVPSGPIVPADPEPVALLALVYLALGPSVAAQLLVLASVRRSLARQTAVSLLIAPITSAALAAAFIGERLSSTEMVGIGLVLVAITSESGLVDRAVGRLRR